MSPTNTLPVQFDGRVLAASTFWRSFVVSDDQRMQLIISNRIMPGVGVCAELIKLRL